MKHCNKCTLDKEESEFSIKGDGRHSICKECVREYNKKHYHINKQKYIERNLLYQPKIAEEVAEYVTNCKNKPCVDCKNSFPPCCMDFDHLRNKEQNISTMVRNRYSLERIKKEIEKCEVVCSNCHRIRTFNRYNIRRIDGMADMALLKSAA